MADENQQSARLLARVCVGLLMLLVSAGAYAFTTHSRYNELCTSIVREASAAKSPATKKLGQEIRDAYCT
jgi:hypothetical protein